jgi:predicted transcriptional regulator
MKNQTIQDIFDVSQAFASGKRLLLLFILRDEPMGYTFITKCFEKMGIPIGSSEIYKHIKQLMEGGYITKKSNTYVLTLKGLRAVENTIDIIRTPPTVPEVKLSFREDRKSK